jgi:hypothetical protein
MPAQISERMHNQDLRNRRGPLQPTRAVDDASRSRRIGLMNNGATTCSGCHAKEHAKNRAHVSKDLSGARSVIVVEAFRASMLTPIDCLGFVLRTEPFHLVEDPLGA